MSAGSPALLGVKSLPECTVMLPQSNPDDLHPLIRKLESIAPVSSDERQAIIALPITVRNLKAHADIIRDQDRPSQCCAILEGFACRYKLLPAGRRQIMSFSSQRCAWA